MAACEPTAAPTIAETEGPYFRTGSPERMSITVDVSFCVEAAEEALHGQGTPAVFNTGQGS